MGRNHEITKLQHLLRQDGTLREPGWSKSMVQKYSRRHVKAPAVRIKEWDYYLVLNEDFAGAFTVSDLGYMGMLSVSLLNFKEGWEHTETVLTPFPMGRFKMPNTSERGDVIINHKRVQIEFKLAPGKRYINCNFENFYNEKPFSCQIELDQPEMDSMVIATPWKEKKTAFYYNQKINCMPASGKMVYDEKEYVFNKESDFGTLDWGRGVWTYDNTWYWGSGNGIIDGKPFGFNIGYGFGDTSAATENMLFYDGKAHKLDDVEFHFSKEDYMKPWKFTSSDGRFEMDFMPIMDRSSMTDVKILVSEQHQVFGKMTGKAILDDGTVIELKDFICFAEDVHNKY